MSAVVVFVFEVADDHAGLEQTVPVAAVEASHLFIVPSGLTSGHRTLKRAGFIHREHATGAIARDGPNTAESNMVGYQ
jgi:hypothetical protein